MYTKEEDRNGKRYRWKREERHVGGRRSIGGFNSVLRLTRCEEEGIINYKYNVRQSTFFLNSVYNK